MAPEGLDSYASFVLLLFFMATVRTLGEALSVGWTIRMKCSARRGRADVPADLLWAALMLDGGWSKDDAGEIHNLRLGTVYTAEISRRGGDSIHAGCWLAVLNGIRVAEISDLDFAKGMVEWSIVRDLTALSDGYRALKARAPTSSDLFPDGAWRRRRERQGLTTMPFRQRIIHCEIMSSFEVVVEIYDPHQTSVMALGGQHEVFQATMLRGNSRGRHYQSHCAGR
jgi:hypothetical protein